MRLTCTKAAPGDVRSKQSGLGTRNRRTRMVRRRTAALLAGLLAVSLALSGRAAQDAAVVTEFGVQVKMRDGVTLRADIYRPEGRRQISGAAAAHALQQGRRARLRPERRRARLRRHHPGRARPLHVRGRVVHVQARVRRWLRHGGVGGRAAVLERQGRNVRRLVRRRHPDAGGHRPSAAPRRHLPRRDGQQLPLELDVPGRRVRAVVQPVVDVGPGAGHARPQHAAPHGRDEGHVAAAARQLPAVQSACRRPAAGGHGNARAVLSSTGSRTRATTATGSSGRSRSTSRDIRCRC